MIYKFDSNNLLFKKTNILLKWKLFTFSLFIIIGFLMISATHVMSKKEKLESELKEKERMISLFKEPFKKENYIPDLKECIGFKLNRKEHQKFTSFALKYRDIIDENHVPATLVWWIAYKESRFDSKAQNASSTASGLFGFTDGTWKEMCKIKGFPTSNKNNEDKQVKILITYLNYLYSKYGSWEKSMNEYHGGKYLYPTKFLFK